MGKPMSCAKRIVANGILKSAIQAIRNASSTTARDVRRKKGEVEKMAFMRLELIRFGSGTARIRNPWQSIVVWCEVTHPPTELIATHVV